MAKNSSTISDFFSRNKFYIIILPTLIIILIGCVFWMHSCEKKEDQRINELHNEHYNERWGLPLYEVYEGELVQLQPPFRITSETLSGSMTGNFFYV